MAVGAVSVPTLIPGSALGLNGTVPPSGRIILGGIGIGGRGSGVLNWMLPERDVHFVAVCDAKKSAREAVKRTVDNKYDNRDCATYRDIREFLAKRTDIDALLIATSDRWHGLMAMWAAQSGKDMYIEKPGAMSINESYAMADNIRRYGVVYQSGAQRKNLWEIRLCCSFMPPFPSQSSVSTRRGGSLRPALLRKSISIAARPPPAGTSPTLASSTSATSALQWASFTN